MENDSGLEKLIMLLLEHGSMKIELKFELNRTFEEKFSF